MRTSIVPNDRTRGTVRFSVGLALLALMIIASAGPARSCACCADAGYRFERTGIIEPDERDMLAAIRFDSMASLASPEYDIEGLPVPSYDDSGDFYGFSLEAAFGVDRWTFNFADNGVLQGTIVFPLPRDIEQFHVDLHDGAVRTGAGGPMLYKEWRLNGPAILNGRTATQIRLIFHGRGNTCTSEGDFSHWTLIAEGTGARFMVFGDLVP